MRKYTVDNKDRLEEIFRKGLYNIEYSPDEESWAKISARLPRQRLLTAKRLSRIAALIALLLFVGGCILLTKHRVEKPEMAKREVLRTTEDVIAAPVSVACKLSVSAPLPEMIMPTQLSVAAPVKISADSPLSSAPAQHSVLRTTPPTPRLQAYTTTLPVRPAPRKWHIGMGGSRIGLAGVSLTSTPTMNMEYNQSDPQPPEEPDESPITRAKSRRITYTTLEPTKIKHLYPFSFGLSASRRLSERWSLQTGLNYSFLRSKWTYEKNGSTAQRQYLHLVGIPLSVSYRLTDWQRPYCYLNAGIVGEVNVAGKLHNEQGTSHIRIPGVLWSCGAKVGIAYPLLRFVSAYAEGGVCYYFDYKGPIITIRSENHFNLSGQVGIQLNF